jgi:molybdenum cofactor biosynthesis enzyme MoaA
MRLQDRHDIQKKLRVSLVDRCNFSCFFCHNEGQGPISQGKPGSLAPEDLSRMVNVAVREGATNVKLTGGEPLLYRSPDGTATILDIVRSIASIRDTRDLFELSMTTNGSLLPRVTEQLAKAGLDRVTISVSTINPTTFKRFISPNISLLDKIATGVDCAHEAGLRPLKLNVPIFYSEKSAVGNLREVHDLIDFALVHRVDEVRFFTLIEHDYFPNFHEFYDFFSETMLSTFAQCFSRHGITSSAETVDILSRIGANFSGHAYPKVEFGVYLDDLTISFEALQYGRLLSNLEIHQEGPYALRIGADGGLRPLLRSEADYSLIDAIRSGATDSQLGNIYHAAQEEMP